MTDMILDAGHRLPATRRYSSALGAFLHAGVPPASSRLGGLSSPAVCSGAHRCRETAVSAKREKADAGGAVWREFDPEGALARPSAPRRESALHEQKVRVRATKKGKKGKTVTEVTGLECPPDSATKLLKKLKVKCGTGGTAKDEAGHVVLEVQGDHVGTVLDELVANGYKSAKNGGGK